MKFSFPLTTALSVVLVSMLIGSAEAQLAHSWVASNGNDGNSACDRSTPCATFSGAFNKTNPGGEITCVDSGNFSIGAVVINKSITINCANAIGSATVPGGVGFSIFTINTAASDIVILRGLDLDALGISFQGPLGFVNFVGAGALHLDSVKINNFRGNNSGIRFTPNGPARLHVADSLIAGNAGNTSNAGILVQPQSGGNANVSVSRSNLQGNVNGIFVDGSAGAVNLNVSDSVVTGSSNSGIALFTSGAPVTALIDGTKVHYNLNTGVAAAGQAVTVRIGRSTISNNVTGVAAFNGANILSFKNNQIKANSTNGTPLAADGLD